MTLIEGIGDEVTDFFIVVAILLIGWLAWCSTSITDQPLIHRVFILRHRIARIAEIGATYQSISAFTRSSNLEISEQESVEATSGNNNDTTSSCPEPSVAVTDTTAEVSPEANRTAEATATEEVLMEAMDSFSNDSTTLLQRQSSINGSEATTTTTAMPTDTSIPTPTCTNTAENATENSPTSNDNEISIKLKFINDDQKVVTGNLKELLGDFKRRHFQTELQAQKLVRLVFNGRILQPDEQTLERCGLYNDCVVHCLVHQPRPASAASQAATLDTSSSIYFNPQSFSDIPNRRVIIPLHNEWDLSRLLVSIVTLILGLAWYSRYHYAQLFTATTTLALYALTAIFSVSFFSSFFSDQDNIRNIE